MKKEKKEQLQLQNRSQGKRISKTVRLVNLANLVIICSGCLLLLWGKPEYEKLANALIVAGALSIVLTIAFQFLMVMKMKKESKK